jgi:hypothetical protein
MILLNSGITFAKLARKTEKTKTEKTKTSDDGSGSWQAGYNCPDLFIAAANGSLQSQGKGTFFAARLTVPSTTAEKTGWCFTMTGTVGPLLQKVMIRDGNTNNWCLQYRYINSKFTYTNPWGGNKYIEGRLQDDSLAIYNFRLNLPWALIGSYINDTEGNMIVSAVNTNDTNMSSTIISLKSLINNNAASYAANKPLLDASTGKGSSLVAEKKKLEDQVKTLTAALATTQASFDAAKKLADDLVNNVKTSKNKIMEFDGRMNGLSTQISTITDTLKTLSTNHGTSASNASSFKLVVDASQTQFNGQMTILKREAPQRTVEINAASAALIAKDNQAIISNLIKIYA